MRISVLGVGHLAGAIVTRWMESGWPASDVVLSPRGQAGAFAKRFGLALATDNAALVAGSDAVLLAVRPADACAAVADLPWQARHILVSACAGVSIKSLAATAGISRIMRIMPLTAVEIGASPTTVYPDFPEMRPALERLGSVLPMRSEAEFEAATTTAAIYGWAQELVRQTTGWLVEKGLEPAMARQLAARTFTAAGRLSAESTHDLDSLMAGITTPGGITELGLNALARDGMPSAWRAACEAVLAKLQGTARQ